MQRIILQQMACHRYLLKNNLATKKIPPLCKIVRMKKLQNPSYWLWWQVERKKFNRDNLGKIYATAVIPREAGTRQHEFTWIVIMKSLAINLPPQLTLGYQVGFHNFFHTA